MSDIRTTGLITIASDAVPEVLRAATDAAKQFLADPAAVATANELAALLVDLAGGDASTSWSMDETDVVCVDDQVIVSITVNNGELSDHWMAMAAVLAERGAVGEFTHRAEDSNELWRTRFADGAAHDENKIDDNFEGDTVIAIGQIQRTDGLDLLVTNSDVAEVVSALLDELQSRAPEHRPGGGLGGRDLLVAWATRAQIRWEIREVTV
ncbi:hypothetical protein [Nocardia tengchongensis]|uniref:hypothetical protein n=1 Tax=Nocardia tengchongensis TaxID=2055889 RepID=UPI0036642289